MDKRTGAGKSRCEFLTFVPLLSVAAKAAENAHAAAELRRCGVRRAVAPHAVQYIGDVAEVGESYASLAEPFTLPAVLFQPELVAVNEDLTDLRLTITFNDSRVEKLTNQDLDLFHQKWAATWIGVELEPTASGDE
ncbi:hypothetical protein Back2_16630 [Nocardioides baekrokdamisoli]|uniref:Uncharacterized protein n=1 Tax=Nocardioides baekrokdamisoli TaxID=1804624 RepID=A0A3G9IGC8_9ACTN|nr:hypothetical protein [Nocardioides baekrokdamisoli]BBH17376.1 hypothetical protein Back2_16630 [Nocardioides baekrokdamisoli]